MEYNLVADFEIESDIEDLNLDEEAASGKLVERYIKMLVLDK